ncbi:MAG: hypothetical protein NXY57DRAFT_1010789 [Lentinula lateritia]|uniref:Uncharacterized protein n=1 Tax=Lentinula lateritia TaxID=40482 RepID=A0ABQ8VJM0_9AGAR|nr:MAG: hypothetical protein NXY57DRAFT_1010789 [Lentinula lateritia]KAJ4496456.1 hypothetical protein C8R41DRAFT_826541 [Lentinula lateritia]
MIVQVARDGICGMVLVRDLTSWVTLYSRGVHPTSFCCSCDDPGVCVSSRGKKITASLTLSFGSYFLHSAYFSLPVFTFNVHNMYSYGRTFQYHSQQHITTEETIITDLFVLLRLTLLLFVVQFTAHFM